MYSNVAVHIEVRELKFSSVKFVCFEQALALTLNKISPRWQQSDMTPPVSATSGYRAVTLTSRFDSQHWVSRQCSIDGVKRRRRIYGHDTIAILRA